MTTQQIQFFDTFGYLSFPELIADCIDEVILAFEDVWKLYGNGHNGTPHDGSRRSCIVPFPDQHPRCASCSTTNELMASRLRC